MLLLPSLPAGLLSLCLAQTISATSLATNAERHQSLAKRQQSTEAVAADGYYIPSSNGGSMLTVVDGTYPAGLHEVMNVIVTSDSDPRVLNEAREAWMAAIGFSSTCLGQWPENQHRANLGDGLGTNNQTDIKRWNYGDYNFGSCQQSIRGGNHFRYWTQVGPEAKSNALFLAASVEDDLDNGHRISEPNGYDMGRDELVGNATTPKSAFGFTFNATATVVQGMLPTGTGSIANNTGINHGIPVDGNVTLLVVSILASDQPIVQSGAFTNTIPLLLSAGIASTLALLLGSTAYLLV